MSQDETAGRSASPKSIDEIAAATGVSRTTVRFVVTGQAARYRIKDATRERIEAYVRDNGIAINHIARSLRLKRSDAIGLVLPDLGNLFFAALTSELEDLCRRNCKVLLTGLSHDDAELERRAIERLTQRGIDGLVVAPCSAATGRSPVLGGRCATVLVDRAFEGSGLPTVTSDNRASAEALAGRLIDEGSSDIEFLAAVPRMPSVADRLAGFRDACRARGIADADARIHTAEVDDIAAGEALMAGVLARRGAPPPVFLTSSLPVLEGALRHLSGRPGGVPRDLLLGTFDYHPLIDFFSNRILSVQQDETAIAGEVFALLSGATPAGPPPRIVVPGRLRQSRPPG